MRVKPTIKQLLPVELSDPPLLPCTRLIKPSGKWQQKSEKAIKYHNQTKHFLITGYACSMHGLDRANRPYPLLSLHSPSKEKKTLQDPPQ